jgi:hypothetical protein
MSGVYLVFRVMGLTEACKFVKDVLSFYGNDHRRNYYLYTDNQAAEHLCTQPNMSEASRGIDMRHHVMKQDYQDGNMRVGGVKSSLNDSDIQTKNLPPPIIHTNDSVYISTSSTTTTLQTTKMRSKFPGHAHTTQSALSFLSSYNSDACTT